MGLLCLWLFADSATHAVFYYCSSVWSPYMKKDIEALEKVQKRATKILPQLKHMNYSGGGGATALPLWPDHKFFWLILHCFCRLHFATKPYKSVPRSMDVCVIACYYTDIHARPRPSKYLEGRAAGHSREPSLVKLNYRWVKCEVTR